LGGTKRKKRHLQNRATTMEGKGSAAGNYLKEKKKCWKGKIQKGGGGTRQIPPSLRGGMRRDGFCKGKKEERAEKRKVVTGLTRTQGHSSGSIQGKKKGEPKEKTQGNLLHRTKKRTKIGRILSTEGNNKTRRSGNQPEDQKRRERRRRGLSQQQKKTARENCLGWKEGKSKTDKSIKNKKGKGKGRKRLSSCAAARTHLSKGRLGIPQRSGTKGKQLRRSTPR